MQIHVLHIHHQRYQPALRVAKMNVILNKMASRQKTHAIIWLDSFVVWNGGSGSPEENGGFSVPWPSITLHFRINIIIWKLSMTFTHFLCDWGSRYSRHHWSEPLAAPHCASGWKGVRPLRRWHKRCTRLYEDKMLIPHHVPESNQMVIAVDGNGW